VLNFQEIPKLMIREERKTILFLEGE